MRTQSVLRSAWLAPIMQQFDAAQERRLKQFNEIAAASDGNDTIEIEDLIKIIQLKNEWYRKNKPGLYTNHWPASLEYFNHMDIQNLISEQEYGKQFGTYYADVTNRGDGAIIKITLRIRGRERLILETNARLMFRIRDYAQELMNAWGNGNGHITSTEYLNYKA